MTEIGCCFVHMSGRRKARNLGAGAAGVPKHLAEIRAARLALIDKTEAAVKDRLTKEIISYWDHRAAQLALEEGDRQGPARASRLIGCRRTPPWPDRPSASDKGPLR